MHYEKISSLTMGFLFVMAAIKIQASTTGTVTKSNGKTERVFPSKPVGKPVSIFTINSFLISFVDVPEAVWKKTINFDEATFIKEEQKLTAYFDYNSELVEQLQ